MKRINQKNEILFFLFLIVFNFSNGQRPAGNYKVDIGKADSLYLKKEFLYAAKMYSKAFIDNHYWMSSDRYKAATAWAMANIPDSAFYHLEVGIVDEDYHLVSSNPDLSSLHKDKRWEIILAKRKKIQDSVQAHYNWPLIAILDTINNDDQKYRRELSDIESKYGYDSKEVLAHWEKINKKDSINLIKTIAILDKYGWLGTDIVGEKGNTTIFLVIQHSPLPVQEKYLPIMREAVKNGKSFGADLALLEDRVAIRNGKKQIYGSQIGQDFETKLYYVLPLEDPDFVDTRRAKVGLPSLASYVSSWNIKWNVEQYKKDLPSIEEKEKQH